MQDTALTKAAKSIKSEFAIFLLIFFSVSIGTYLVFRITKEDKPSPQNLGYENKIFPGKTTKDQVKSKLGDPLRVETDGNFEEYVYPTENKFREDEIAFSGETVSVVKEQVLGQEKGTLYSYQNELGPEEAIFYSDHSQFAPGYFWGAKGIMVFGSKYDGAITEIWYFNPTSKEDFLSNNTGFSETEEVHREEF